VIFEFTLNSPSRTTYGPFTNSPPPSIINIGSSSNIIVIGSSSNTIATGTASRQHRASDSTTSPPSNIPFLSPYIGSSSNIIAIFYHKHWQFKQHHRDWQFKQHQSDRNNIAAASCQQHHNFAPQKRPITIALHWQFKQHHRDLQLIFYHEHWQFKQHHHDWQFKQHQSDKNSIVPATAQLRPPATPHYYRLTLTVQATSSRLTVHLISWTLAVQATSSRLEVQATPNRQEQHRGSIVPATALHRSPAKLHSYRLTLAVQATSKRQGHHRGSISSSNIIAIGTSTNIIMTGSASRQHHASDSRTSLPSNVPFLSPYIRSSSNIIAIGSSSNIEATGTSSRQHQFKQHHHDWHWNQHNRDRNRITAASCQRQQDLAVLATPKRQEHHHATAERGYPETFHSYHLPQGQVSTQSLVPLKAQILLKLKSNFVHNLQSNTKSRPNSIAAAAS
jgi:hypothetical protein